AHARRRPIFALSALPPPPHSFPTRRSSDLFAARLDGAPSERRLSLDQVGWGLIQATEWRWLGDQQLWSLEAYLPLGPAPGRVGYGLQARAVWLQEPLAWDAAASARAAPGRQLPYVWSGGETLRANRDAS